MLSDGGLSSLKAGSCRVSNISGRFSGLSKKELHNWMSRTMV